MTKIYSGSFRMKEVLLKNKYIPPKMEILTILHGDVLTNSPAAHDGEDVMKNDIGWD